MVNHVIVRWLLPVSLKSSSRHLYAPKQVDMDTKSIFMVFWFRFRSYPGHVSIFSWFFMIFMFSKIFYGASWVLKSAVWPCPPLFTRVETNPFLSFPPTLIFDWFLIDTTVLRRHLLKIFSHCNQLIYFDEFIYFDQRKYATYHSNAWWNLNFPKPSRSNTSICGAHV